MADPDPLAPAPPARHVPELDVIRVVAASLVVLYHYTFSGWAAVDAATHVRYGLISEFIRYIMPVTQIFFALSGFVVVASAHTSTARRFFRARALRILPLFWLFCTVSWLISRNHQPFAPLSGTTYVANLLFVAVPVGLPLVDAVYWTLTVEVVFYGALWLVLLTGSLHRLRVLVPVWLALGVLVDVAGALDGGSGLLAQLGFISRWNGSFAVGICCFWLRRDRRDRMAWWVLAIAAVLNSWAAWRVASDIRPYLLPGISLHNWITVVFLLVGQGSVVAVTLRRTAKPWRPKRIKRWAVMGGLTYPVYLLHENLGLILIDRFDWVERWTLLLAVLVIVVGVSWLATHYLERPFVAWFCRRTSLRSGGPLPADTSAARHVPGASDPP